ncbi:MAG: hypothetical protein K5872_05145 [Rhizobiaceae bacterium]|nr:hypothetical protein [Rhizobiaceae bacterium]MCV0405596.1 hypothetical protein [Rhizobiaceae bacterium]
MRRVAVVLLGTDAATRETAAKALALLGCDRATSSGDADPISAVNRHILESAGTDEQDLAPLNAGWYRSPKAYEFHEKALSALEEAFGGSGLFLLDDASIGRLAPFWMNVLEAADVRPVVLSLVTGPAENRTRGQNVGDVPTGDFQWLRHMLDLEQGTRGQARRFLDAHDVVSGDLSLPEEFSRAFGFDLPKSSSTTRIELDAMLGAARESAFQDGRRRPRDAIVSTWAREAQAIFDRWCEKGETEADHASLDRIRGEFDVAADGLSRLFIAARRAAARVEELEEELSRQTEAHAQLEETLREERGRLAQAQSALEQRRHEAEQTALELTEAKQTFSSERQALERKLAEEREQHAQKRHEAEETALALAKLKETVSSERQSLVQEREQHAQTRDRLEQKRHEAERQLEERWNDIARLTSDLQARDKEVESLRAGKSDAERQLDERLNDIVRLTSDLQARDEDMESLRAENAEEAERREKAESQVRERFAEIATLTSLLRDREYELEILAKPSSPSSEANEGAVAQTPSPARAKGGALRRVGKVLSPRIIGTLAARARAKREAAKLERSGLFDAEWYLSRYPDVAAAGMNPAFHYVMFGLNEGRSPNADAEASGGAF